MNLTPEQLTQIEEYASSFFSPTEIAIIMGLDKQQLKLELAGDNAAANAYNKGQLIQEAKIRKAIIDLATKGSSPAQTLAMDIIKTSKTRNIEI